MIANAEPRAARSLRFKPGHRSLQARSPPGIRTTPATPDCAVSREEKVWTTMPPVRPHPRPRSPRSRRSL